MHTVWDESGRSALSAGRGRRLAAMAALCAAGLGGAAQAESMEEAARAAAQHHAAAAADAERAGPGQRRQGGGRGAARRGAEAGSLARSACPRQGQAEKLSQQQSAVLESAQSQIAASNAQLGKFKGAYDELLVLARTKESERAKRRAGPARRQVKSCVAKNREMYQAGKDILNATSASARAT